MNTRMDKVDYLITSIIIVAVILFYVFLSMGGLQFQTPSNQTSQQPPPLPPQPVGVEPQTQTVKTGETFSVNVVNNNAKDLYGFQFDLNYDPAILRFVSIEASPLLKKDNAQVFCVPSNTSTSGIIKNVACTRLGRIGGVDGKGVLAKVTFTALSSGTSELRLSNVKLSRVLPNTNKPQSIEPEVFSAQVTVE